MAGSTRRADAWQRHHQGLTATGSAQLINPAQGIGGRQLNALTAAKRAGPTWQETGLIFTTGLGTPIEPRNFYRSWRARCIRAGVPPISVHDARRTCASLLVDLDVHPRIAMAILRHADFSITMEVYSQASPKATRDALKRLGSTLE